MSQHNWTVILEEDPNTGEVILPLPDELLLELGWTEGTEIQWVDNKNGTFTLKEYHALPNRS